MKANFNDAQHVLRTLIDAGHEAFLAGGCVRDMLLGLQPNDYDIATSAHPEEVQSIFPRTVPVGVSFGVVKVICDGDREIDVATFRADGVYTDNRRPDSVVYSKTAAEDVKRRDFTINAMLQDIDGNIIDYVGGQADLKARVLRTVGNASDRFKEDALRMMRALRFAVRFDLNIDRDTEKAILHYKASIRNVSKERITEELTRMFSYGNCDKAFWLLNKSGLWNEWFPIPLDLDDNYRAMFGLAEIDPGEPFILPLTIILHGAYPPHRKELLERLSLTNSQEKAFDNLLNHSKEMCAFLRRPLRDQRRMMNWSDKELACKLVECLSMGNIDKYNLLQGETVLMVSREMARITAMGFPKPLINGNDLQEMGYIPSSIFTRILEAVQDHQLDCLLDRAGVKDFLLSKFPAAPRKLEDGTIYDRMSAARLIAACKKCSRIMSFTVSFNEDGTPKWSTASGELGVRVYGGQYTYVNCKHCSTRRKKTSFVRSVVA